MKAVVTKIDPVEAYNVKVQCPYPECYEALGDDEPYSWTEVVTKKSREIICPNCEAYLEVKQIFNPKFTC